MLPLTPATSPLVSIPTESTMNHSVVSIYFDVVSDPCIIALMWLVNSYFDVVSDHCSYFD